MIEKDQLRTNLDLLIANGILWVLLGLILLDFSAPLRIPFAILSLLFIPGYVALTALYSRSQELSVLERIAFSIAFSMALVIFSGLVLNFTPWGIRTVPVALANLGLTGALSVAAYRRRQHRVPPAGFDGLFRLPPLASAWRALPMMDRLVYGFLVLSVVVLIGAVGYKLSQRPPGSAFTEFYVLGQEGLLRDYPPRLIVGEPTELQVGIGNRERQEIEYTVRAVLEDATVGQLQGIRLVPGEEWLGPLQVVAQEPAEAQRLDLLLIRDGDTEPLHRLHLWVDVLP